MGKTDTSSARIGADFSFKSQLDKLRGALVRAEPARPTPGASREAAVLVPLIERHGELSVVFIRRSDRVESHRGQVAFPGGRVEPSDATLLDTALREANEEVGIEPGVVDVLGGFPTMKTIQSAMAVASFVGLLTRPVDFRIDPIEVAEIFEVPIAALADERWRGHYEWRGDGSRPTSQHPAIFYAGQTIWGLTLRITDSLLEIIGAREPQPVVQGS